MADLFQKYPRLQGLMDAEEVLDEGGQVYDFDKCWTVENPQEAYDEEDVAAALIVARGSYGRAARLLKRNRRSLENHVMRNQQLYNLREDLRDEFLDAVEELHMNAALRGDLTTQRFFLTTVGKNRGYVTRTEATGADGKPLMEAPTIDKEQLSKVTNDALEELLKARGI